jgi:hypothetical protein
MPNDVFVTRKQHVTIAGFLSSFCGFVGVFCVTFLFLYSQDRRQKKDHVLGHWHWNNDCIWFRRYRVAGGVDCSDQHSAQQK